MASSLLAHCRMLLEVDTSSANAVAGTFGERGIPRSIEIDTRWTEGNASGQVQREYFEEKVCTALGDALIGHMRDNVGLWRYLLQKAK